MIQKSVAEQNAPIRSVLIKAKTVENPAAQRLPSLDSKSAFNAGLLKASTTSSVYMCTGVTRRTPHLITQPAKCGDGALGAALGMKKARKGKDNIDSTGIVDVGTSIDFSTRDPERRGSFDRGSSVGHGFDDKRAKALAMKASLDYMSHSAASASSKFLNTMGNTLGNTLGDTRENAADMNQSMTTRSGVVPQKKSRHFSPSSSRAAHDNAATTGTLAVSSKSAAMSLLPSLSLSSSSPSASISLPILSSSSGSAAAENPESLNRMVRQCELCQVLYTTFHNCRVAVGKESSSSSITTQQSRGRFNDDEAAPHIVTRAAKKVVFAKPVTIRRSIELSNPSSVDPDDGYGKPAATPS